MNDYLQSAFCSNKLMGTTVMFYVQTSKSKNLNSFNVTYILKRQLANYEHFFEKFSFLFKSLVKAELS